MFSIDTKGLFYSLKLMALIGAILFSADTIRTEIPSFIADTTFADDTAFISASRIPAGRPSRNAAEEFGGGAAIFSNHDLVLAKRDELIAKKENFLYADLEAMKLSLYQGGEAIKTYPIAGKGKDGSFFETPAGMYAIRSKEKNHFSAIGKVWMPWSMHFFGNYFIHGMPYYPNGKPVSDSFSGGCIRLGTEDAKELFALSESGMTVLVNSHPPKGKPPFAYFKKAEPVSRASSAIDRLPARALLAADLETGQILYQKNKDEAHPIASLTKLMTGLVALESINRFKILSIDKKALDAEGNSAGFVEGEEFSSEELLYPLLLESSNDAALLYRNQIGNFVPLMNDKARALGLDHTHYEESIGLDPQNVSSAQDLFKLLQFISRNKKPLFAISTLREKSLSSRNKLKTHQWKNVSWPDAGDARFVGGKSGFTPEALETIAGVFKAKISESEERPIAIVVLGSRKRVDDVNAVIRYLEDNFVYGSTVADENANSSAPIETGASIYKAFEGAAIPASRE